MNSSRYLIRSLLSTGNSSVSVRLSGSFTDTINGGAQSFVVNNNVRIKDNDIILTANRLEAITERESQLRTEYQQELDGKTTEIEKLTKRESELQATIDRQLETLTELTGKATDTAKVEQRNHREKLLAARVPYVTPEKAESIEAKEESAAA